MTSTDISLDIEIFEVDSSACFWRGCRQEPTHLGIFLTISGPCQHNCLPYCTEHAAVIVGLDKGPTQCVHRCEGTESFLKLIRMEAF